MTLKKVKNHVKKPRPKIIKMTFF